MCCKNSLVAPHDLSYDLGFLRLGYTFKRKEKTSQWKMTVRKKQMLIKLFGHGHSHAETTPNEAFSDTQVPCTAGCYQRAPSPQDRVH